MHSVLLASSAPTLASGLDGFRLIIHALAATIWVGGQFTVAGLLPTIRTLGDDAPKKVAGALGRLLWPAYGVLILTGFWNISAVDAKHASSAWNAVLGWPSSSISGPPRRSAWLCGAPSAPWPRSSPSAWASSWPADQHPTGPSSGGPVGIGSPARLTWGQHSTREPPSCRSSQPTSQVLTD
jgi:hypothetical protein